MSKYTEENPFNLTTKQLKFCEFYLFHETYQGNARQSAIQSGYKEKNSDVIASQNLTKLSIQKHLKFLEDKFAKELQKRTPADAAAILDKVINKDYNVEYAPVNLVKALELWFRLHDKFPKTKLPFRGDDGEEIEVSEQTRIVMIMPNERPLPQMPGEQIKEPEPVKEVKTAKPINNEAKNLILETLIKKGAYHGNKQD